MKVIKALLLVAAAALSLSAQATTTIRILTVFTAAGAAYVNTYGPGVNSTVANQISSLNTILTNSGIDVQVVDAGHPVGVCCSGTSTLDQDTGIAGDSIATLAARDSSNADMVIVIDELPVQYALDGSIIDGITRTIPATVTSASSAVQADALQFDVYAHEFAHQLGATHSGAYFFQTGTNGSNCTVFWTTDLGEPTLAAQQITTSTVGACWATIGFSGSDCYQDGHSALVARPPGSSTPPISWSGGHLASSTQWVELASWSGGSLNDEAFAGSPHTFYSTFTCPVAEQAPYFSNPAKSFLGYPTGTSTNNNAATITANAAAVSDFHNTKLAARALLLLIVGFLMSSGQFP